MQNYIVKAREHIDNGRKYTARYVIPTCNELIEGLRQGMFLNSKIDKVDLTVNQWHMVPTSDGLLLTRPDSTGRLYRSPPGSQSADELARLRLASRSDTKPTPKSIETHLIPYTKPFNRMIERMYGEVLTLINNLNAAFKDRKRGLGVSFKDMRMASTRTLTDQIRFTLALTYFCIYKNNVDNLSLFSLPIAAYQHMIFKLSTEVLTEGAMYRDNDEKKFLNIESCDYFNIIEQDFGTGMYRVINRATRFNAGDMVEVDKYYSLLLTFGDRRDDGTHIEVDESLLSTRLKCDFAFDDGDDDVVQLIDHV